jgi:chitodextrinase
MKIHALFHMQTAGRWSLFLLLSLVFGGWLLGGQSAPVRAAGTNCITSGPAGGAYTITPCITAPADGSTVSGLVTVSANYTTTGANPGVAKLIFYLNGSYLLTDFQSPYSYVLPTTKWVDGTYVLAVSALMKDGFVSQLSSITITFNNGITTPPVNTNTFTPASGTTPVPGQPFVVAAAGDGADGAIYAGSVASLISSWNPNLFLYLGDVYEKGSPAEFFNWYGTPGTLFGNFYSITNPVVGNHEYENGIAPGYFDFWNNIPSYYSYDTAGWHFIALNSNCSLLRICASGQNEYQWLQNDLATHPNACTIAYYHHPVFNVGPEGYTTTMKDIWSLLAQYGVTIVLNGHDHNYQRWIPLDGNGNPSSSGITEFVVGSGGHGIQTFVTTDSRLVVGYDTSPNSFGALQMQLNPEGVGYQFINYQGALLDSGTIPCHGTSPDTIAPTTPTNLAASSTSSFEVDLSWTSSTDNVGVAGYDIYRNGEFLTSIGPLTKYNDLDLAPGTTYGYQIRARDGAGNTSSLSNTATVTTSAMLFSDGFESGDLSLWTNASNLSVQQQAVYDGSYAARETSNGTVKTYATKTLSTTQMELYYSTAFKIISKSSSTSAYLQRFRTSANGSILGLLITSNGKLAFRNFVNSSTNSNGPVVSTGFWHQVETHLRINGTSSLVEVWLDGAQIPALSQTVSLGTNPIGILELGDSTASDTYDIALDDVRANTSFIAIPDLQPPTVPTGLTATATAPDSVSLSWNASADNVGVTGYDVYRNGSLLTMLGAVTSYTDITVSPSFTYEYQVDARDAAGNSSGLSSSATVTAPADTIPPTVSLTAPISGATVSGNVAVSADASDNVSVDHVNFLINGSIIDTEYVAPYAFIWDSTTVANGTVIITAQAVDSSSNSTTSTEVPVTVNNPSSGTPTSTPTVNFTPTNTTTPTLTATANFTPTNTTTPTLTATANFTPTNTATPTLTPTVTNAPTASATSSALLFSDGFENGNLSLWSGSTNLAIQQQQVYSGLYAARATSSGKAASYAYLTLNTPQTNLYYSLWFKVLSQGTTSAYLQRFRTSTNTAIGGLLIASGGKLSYRNDVTNSTVSSSTVVTQNVWHRLETHLSINGTSSLIEVWLDGTQISALSRTDNFGTASIGRIHLGDFQSSDVYDIALDEVKIGADFIP